MCKPITRWERWIMTPETDIFASSSSSIEEVKTVINWYKKLGINWGNSNE